jgi:hypothetical protein
MPRRASSTTKDGDHRVICATLGAGGLRLISVLTCPACGKAAEEAMPTDACIYFYECGGCGAMLKPRPGDCCVFCSYGDTPCPPVQAGDDCGCSQESL